MIEADRRPADDGFRTLIGDIQDEFAAIKRGAVRADYVRPGPLTVQDVLDFGAEIGKDFPRAQKGCEVFASVWVIEQRENARNN